MKAKTLSLMATAGLGSVLLGQAAPAAYTGLEVLPVDNAFGLSVIQVYATFDNVNDVMVAVAGTPNAPLSIQAIGGDFFQSPFGGDTAPGQVFVDLFPTLALDTFVTIGLAVVPTGFTDQTSLTPGWPGFGANSLPADPADGTNIGWFITPDQPQGQPDADGRVLIGQFAMGTPIGPGDSGFEGTFLIQAVSDGDQGFQTVASFSTLVPTPGALALLGLAGLVGRRRRR